MKKKGSYPLSKLLFILNNEFSHRKPNKKNLRIAKYRWEFLRRNPNYKNDYNEYKAALQNPESNASGKIGFCQRWKIGEPFNPKYSFDEIMNLMTRMPFNELSSEYYDEEEYILSKILPDFRFDSPIEDSEMFVFKGSGTNNYDLTPDPSVLESGILEIKIDLNYSKNAIKEEFARILNYWKDLHEEREKKALERLKIIKSRLKINIPERIKNDYLKKIEKLQEVIKKRDGLKIKIREQSVLPFSRKEFNHYDNYLKVWDLVQKKGKRWAAIAKIIFPNDADNESARKKVANYFESAEKVINAMGKVNYPN